MAQDRRFRVTRYPMAFYIVDPLDFISPAVVEFDCPLRFMIGDLPRDFGF
jgi:hypothetical protein